MTAPGDRPLLDPAPLGRHVRWTFASRAVSLALGLAVAAIYPHVLGKAGMGAVAYLTLVPQTLFVAGGLGLDLGTILCLRERRDETTRLLSTSATAGFLLGILYLAVAAGAFATFPALRRGTPLPTCLLALAGMPVSMVVTLLQPQMLPLGLLRTFHALPSAFNLLRLAGLVAAWASGTEPVRFLLAWFLGMSVAHAAAVVFAVRRRLPLRPCLDLPLLRAALREGLPSVPTTLAAHVSTRADQYLLARSAGDAALGVYAYLVQIAEHLFLFPNAVGQGLMARFVAPTGSDPAAVTARVCRLTLLLGAGGAAASVGVVAALVATGPISWAEAWLPYLLLCGAVLCYSVSKVLAPHLLHRRRQGAVAAIAVGTAALNVALNLAWIPRAGAAGAAAASLVSYGANGALSLWLFARVTGRTAAETTLPRREDLRTLSRALGRP